MPRPHPIERQSFARLGHAAWLSASRMRFDRIKVWAEGRKEHEPGAGTFDGIADTGCFVRRQVIHNTRVHFAREGLGIARLPELVVREHIEDGRIESILRDFVDGSNTLHVLWPGSRYPTPKGRVFIDFLREHLSFEASLERPELS